VRRARRFTLEELAPYLLEIPESPHFFEWHALFGNDHPVEMEVGFGKGMFLVGAAHTHPDSNYLGIEIARKYQLFTASRMAKRQLRNVRLVKADARQFLRDCVKSGSCRALHVYFPDPWWKKRHLKRRLFTGDFVAQCARVLQPGGRLSVATDVEQYSGEIGDLLAAEPLLRAVPLPLAASPAHDLDYLTNFERKYLKAGRTIYRHICER
jgi:tRNA (guanine-N7-)-methyltransferase